MRAASQPSNSSIDDLNEYVDAFRTSSNRSRYSLYIVIIASVLIGIATYNAHGGWPLRRLEAWYGQPLAQQTFMGGDTLQLKIAREEYLRQFISRGVMPASPIPGVSMDVNDLGLVGGTALVLLTLIMLFCTLREHENLQLALFKVRQLCVEDEEGPARGDSRANLLYHALAMGQVLNSPPTLARWRRRGVLRHFGFIFFTPVAVQGWVLWNNYATRHVGQAYGADVRLNLALQLTLFVVILVLSASALICTRAMARRWERAFYRVNPGRRVAPQPTLLSWMKLARPRKPQGRLDELRPRLVTTLVDSLAVADSRKQGRVGVGQTVEVTRPWWSRRRRPGPRPVRIRKPHMRQMSQALFEEGEELAKGWCAQNDRGTFATLAEFHPERNEYRARHTGGDVPAEWEVTGTWTFYYVPAAPVG